MAEVLRLLLPGKFPPGVFLPCGALDLMTDFPSLALKLDFAGKLRLRLWYLLCIHQMSSAITKCATLSAQGPHNPPAAFNGQRLAPGIIRDMVRWLAVSREGFETHSSRLAEQAAEIGAESSPATCDLDPQVRKAVSERWCGSASRGDDGIAERLGAECVQVTRFKQSARTNLRSRRDLQIVLCYSAIVNVCEAEQDGEMKSRRM